jgi:FtsZ-binding cell division protein ZapB
MDRLENLERKIRKAAEQLVALRHENQRLNAELKFLQEENQRAKQLIRDNDVLREEKKTVSNRIEKLLKKIHAQKI